VRPIKPKFYTYKDVPTDDDLTRLVHATNAYPEEVFHYQVCSDPSCICSGSGWSTKILAEVWHETLPHHAPEIVPQIGTTDPLLSGFINQRKGDR
jgi:hypothetical protein